MRGMTHAFIHRERVLLCTGVEGGGSALKIPASIHQNPIRKQHTIQRDDEWAGGPSEMHEHQHHTFGPGRTGGARAKCEHAQSDLISGRVCVHSLWLWPNRERERERYDVLNPFWFVRVLFDHQLHKFAQESRRPVSPGTEHDMLLTQIISEHFGYFFCPFSPLQRGNFCCFYNNIFENLV